MHCKIMWEMLLEFLSRFYPLLFWKLWHLISWLNAPLFLKFWNELLESSHFVFDISISPSEFLIDAWLDFTFFRKVSTSYWLLIRSMTFSITFSKLQIISLQLDMVNLQRNYQCGWIPLQILSKLRHLISSWQTLIADIRGNSGDNA